MDETKEKIGVAHNLLIKDKDLEALTKDVSHLPERFSTDESLLRRVVFCRETHKERVQMFEELVKWHEEYKPEEIQESEIQEELKIGSFFINGTDRMGRPILIVFGSRHDPAIRDLDKTVRALCYWMVKGIASMRPGVEQFVIIYDRENVTRKNFDIAFCKEWAQIQNYFPLRLGLALVLQPNWIFQMSYKVCSVFLSEEAKSKIQLTTKNWKNELQQLIEKNQLLTCHGGTMETSYEHTLAVRKGICPLSESQRARHMALEEAKAEGDLKLQSALVAEQYSAWGSELESDESRQGEVLRRRLNSYNSKTGRFSGHQ